jgi:hypothetical protein
LGWAGEFVHAQAHAAHPTTELSYYRRWRANQAVKSSAFADLVM